MPSPSDPVALHLGGLAIRWYAIFILSGILVGIALVRWLARRRGMDPEFPLDAAPWVVLGAIVGARLYYVLLKWHYFLHNPGEAINIRLGGMTIHGAVAVGALMLWYACRRYGQPFFAWADLVVAGVAIGQAIGRWGNWANQEAFGTPSTLPWAVQIQPDRRPEQYPQYATFHPTFLYESLFDLANTVLLVWLVLRMPRSRWLRAGDVAWIYFIVYGIGRFLIERIRTDSLYIGPLPAAYWVSFGLIIIGTVMLILRHTIWPERPADPGSPAAAESGAEESPRRPEMRARRVRDSPPGARGKPVERVCGVILAAGRSTRLGRPKQLLPLAGRPLLDWTVERAAASALAQVIVVLGSDAAAIEAALPARGPRVRVVINPAFAAGQSTSLRAGLAAIDPAATAVLFLLGDQPGVTPAIIDALIAARVRTGAGRVQPRYGQTPGNPVLFGRALFPALAAVTGDEGARAILRARRDDVLAVTFPDLAPPGDVDTDEDYATLQAGWLGVRHY